MLFRFGVVLTPGSTELEVFVSGSRVEMGHWDPEDAVPMTSSRSFPSSKEPGLWVGDVVLSEPCGDALWFKFVQRREGRFIWEGNGPHHDRCFDERNVLDGVYCHTISHWMEETGHTDELKHTTDFYLSGAKQQAMHYSRFNKEEQSDRLVTKENSHTVYGRGGTVRPTEDDDNADGLDY